MGESQETRQVRRWMEGDQEGTDRYLSLPSSDGWVTEGALELGWLPVPGLHLLIPVFPNPRVSEVINTSPAAESPSFGKLLICT